MADAKYKKGQEPWNKWLIVYRCKLCDGFLTEEPDAKVLAAMDLHEELEKETPTQGHMLRYALHTMPATVGHQCDKRTVGMAELLGVVREGSVIVVVGH